MSNYISKITLPDGSTYDIKDAWAREQLAVGLTIVVLNASQELPTADSTTMGKLYFKPHSHSANDSYDEYVTVRTGSEGSYVYSWEKIGNTDIDLSNYSTTSHYHTVTVGAHTYTPDGSINVRQNEQGNYTPAGKIEMTNGSASSHSHAIGSTKKYLHTTDVIKADGLDTSAVVNALTKRYIETSTGYIPNLTTVEAARVIGSGTEVQFATISGTYDITYLTEADNIDIKNYESSTQISVITGATAVNTSTGDFMYDASVNNETLSFKFKNFTNSSVLESISFTDTSVSHVTGSNTTTIHDVSATASSISVYDVSTINVAQINASNPSTSITYATGDVSTNSNSSTFAPIIVGGTTTTAVIGLKTNGSIGAYTSINNSSSSGTAIITDVSANTGNAGSTVSGEFTFTGETVDILFDGSTATLSHSQATTSAAIEPTGGNASNS